MANEKGLLRYGDKLPHALLPDEEWTALCNEIDAAENPKNQQFRKHIYAELREYEKKYCVGENYKKCLLCGEPQNKEIGLCSTCYQAFRTRGVIRKCGKTRAVKNSQVICRVCGERAAQTMGICRNCYHKLKKKGLPNVEALIEYNRKEKADFVEGNFIFVKKKDRFRKKL